MIEHSKAIVATAIGAAAGLVPWLLASLSSFFSDIRVILTVVSLLVGFGGGLIALFVQKLIRDWADKWRESEDARTKEVERQWGEFKKEVTAQLRALEREVSETKGLFSETLAKSQTLRDEVIRAQRELEALDARLRTGAETFARMEGRLGVLEGRRR